LIGDVIPGFIFYPDRTRQYYRFGDDDGTEPFIFCRDLQELKPGYIEISEELRHFHNLYEDRKREVFLTLDDTCDDAEVVRMSPEKVKVRSKYPKD
jgi:hypothetical protein